MKFYTAPNPDAEVEQQKINKSSNRRSLRKMKEGAEHFTIHGQEKIKKW